MLPTGFTYAMNNARGINYAIMAHQLVNNGADIKLEYRSPKWGEDRTQVMAIGQESFKDGWMTPNLDALCCPENNDPEYKRIRSLLEDLWNKHFPQKPMPLV